MEFGKRYNNQVDLYGTGRRNPYKALPTRSAFLLIATLQDGWTYSDPFSINGTNTSEEFFIENRAFLTIGIIFLRAGAMSVTNAAIP